MSDKRVSKEEKEFQEQLERRWISITEDGGVRKIILQEGDGIIPKKGTQVAVHCNVVLEDGTVIADTFEKKHPLKLTIGGEASIQGVELAIASMKFGEKACLEISPQYGFGAMDNKFGFHGFGVPIPPNSKLIFTELHLLPLELALPKSTTQWIAQAETNKANGNKAFTDKKYDEARNEYESALKIVDRVKQQFLQPLVLDGKTDEQKEALTKERTENEQKSKELLLLCHSNLAQVFLKLKSHDKAKEHCEKALVANPKHAKSLWRLALVHKELNQFESALKRLEEAKQCATETELKSIEKDITDTLKLQKEQNNRDKTMWTGILNAAQKGKALYEGVEPGKPEMWKCNYCGQEMEQIQQARHIIKMHSDPRDKGKREDFDLPDKFPVDFKTTTKKD
jgi:hypothetical protein